MDPAPVVSVGWLLNCHIPPFAVLANSRHGPRFWAARSREKRLEPGDKICVDPSLRARRFLRSAQHQLNLGGNASLEHVARVIQTKLF